MIPLAPELLGADLVSPYPPDLLLLYPLLTSFTASLLCLGCAGSSHLRALHSLPLLLPLPVAHSLPMTIAA